METHQVGLLIWIAILVLVYPLPCALLSAWMAERTGRSSYRWFLIGFFLGIFGVGIAYLVMREGSWPLRIMAFVAAINVYTWGLYGKLAHNLHWDEELHAYSALVLGIILVFAYAGTWARIFRLTRQTWERRPQKRVPLPPVVYRRDGSRLVL